MSAPAGKTSGICPVTEAELDRVSGGWDSGAGAPRPVLRHRSKRYFAAAAGLSADPLIASRLLRCPCVERSAMRACGPEGGSGGRRERRRDMKLRSPDFASLHPGYMS